MSPFLPPEEVPRPCCDDAWHNPTPELPPDTEVPVDDVLDVQRSALAGLAPLMPGAQGVVYDTAFRGVHHQRLMRDLGWVSVNRVTANAGSRKRPAKDRKRVEKTVYVETKSIRTPDGEQQVRLISQGGRIGSAPIATPTSAGPTAGTTTTDSLNNWVGAL